MYRIVLLDPEVGAPRVWGEGSTPQKARTAARWEWQEQIKTSPRWMHYPFEAWRELQEIV